MSDSDDGTFESADEGETVSQNKEMPKTSTMQETDKEKHTDNKKKTLKEDSQAAATDNRQASKKDASTEQAAKKGPHNVATKQTGEKRVDDKDNAKGVTKESRGKTKKGRRNKTKQGSGTKAEEDNGIKTKEGLDIKKKDGDDIKTKECSEFKAEEGSEITAVEGSEIEVKKDSERKANKNSEIETKEDSEIKTKEDSESKAKEDSESKAKEGIESKVKEDSESKAKEGIESKVKEDSESKEKEGIGSKAKEDSMVVTKEVTKGIIDQGSKGETVAYSGTDTTEYKQRPEEKKTRTDEETNTETKHIEGSPKATRKIERRQPPAVEDVPQKKSSGWGWGGWGSSILSTATQSVASLTSTVGEGFSTVMETVEMGLGAVSPEELAQMSGKKQDGGTEMEEIARKMKDGPDEETMERTSDEVKQEKGGMDKGGSTVPAVTKQLDHTPTGDEQWEKETSSMEELKAEEDAQGKKELQEDDEEEDISLTSLIGELGSAASVATKWGFTGFSNVRSAVKMTGMTIVTGGLDVLETIGKTTYDVLAEGDTGLKAILMKASDKPDLSKVLREAKDVAEVKAKENEEFEEARKANFGAQFDEFQGLVQLEALESLSAECNSGVQTLLNTMPRISLEDVKPQLIAIKEAFHLKDIDSDDEDEKEQDFGELVTEHASALGVNVSVQKLLQVEESIKKWLTSYRESQDKRSIRQGKEIHQKAIQSLAEFTATTVAFFHRASQLLLMDATIPGTMYKKIAANLASVTQVSCTEVTILSSMFTQCLNTALVSTENAAVVINPLITDVYLEASNSSTYIQDAFQLLLPILQKATIQVSVPQLCTLSGNS